MRQLELKHAQAGMMLSENALGRHGQLLLRAGTVLSDRHLQMLRAHAVERICVGPVAPGDGRPAAACNDEAQLAARFGLCDLQHPLISELRRVCRQRFNPASGEHDHD